MRVEQLEYELPTDLIAQRPVRPRDRARLLVLNRATGAISHHHFSDLVELLSPWDCLVLNDTRVVPARLVGLRAATGGRWEGLFLRRLESGLWELMCQTRGLPRIGEVLTVGACEERLILRGRTAEGHWLVESDPPADPESFLTRFGHVPLPRYIRGGVGESTDVDDYQTVYARCSGAVAAPTAGLHFTEALLERLRGRGVEIARLTLHVGLGTFEPLRDSLATHRMHSEWGELSEASANLIESRRAGGGRTVAIGTTSVRVLETAASTGMLQAWKGETSICIYPPYRFRAVDVLVTNFHLPRTTLLALVFAFAGADQIREAYAVAIRERYRFYSFGDAMLIL